MKEDYQISRVSPVSGKEHTMTINFDMEDYKKWNKGTLIQIAMPYLTPGVREWLRSGITEQEWTDLFKDEEE